jgi:hypothetical protein
VKAIIIYSFLFMALCVILIYLLFYFEGAWFPKNLFTFKVVENTCVFLCFLIVYLFDDAKLLLVFTIASLFLRKITKKWCFLDLYQILCSHTHVFKHIFTKMTTFSACRDLLQIRPKK